MPEIWNTEVHGWKSTSSQETKRLRSTLCFKKFGRDSLGSMAGWQSAKKNHGHAYILNETDTDSPIRGIPTRNVKYFIFKKLSETSNYGHALNIIAEPDPTIEPDDPSFTTSALIKGNLMTVWVINREAGHCSA